MRLIYDFRDNLEKPMESLLLIGKILKVDELNLIISLALGDRKMIIYEQAKKKKITLFREVICGVSRFDERHP